MAAMSSRSPPPASTPAASGEAMLLAGVPALNKAVFHRVRFAPHDPVSWIKLADGRRVMIVRDVELPRARASERADDVDAYEDFTPDGGLSGDRAIRAAQATAECLVRNGVKRVVSDRSLALIYVDELRRRGIEVECDREMGVLDRRRKDEGEVAALQKAQSITEDAIRMACERIAAAPVDDEGRLRDKGRGAPLLTSERVKTLLDVYLAEHQCVSEGHIVAGGLDGADCHEPGSGALRSGQPVIVDVFPKHLPTGYHGDCTRTVVHGKVPRRLAHMHAAVAKAKRAALRATRAGVTGEQVHRAAVEVIEREGYALGFPPVDAADTVPADFCSMPHGTGHGIGLDLKEPPLLDFGGPELVEGDAVTVEPGLYALDLGGVRLEDMVIVSREGHLNLNKLHEGLDWR
jgi:Xaa-Pro aminopeptidase